MESISHEMSGWMTHKLELRLARETATASDMQMHSNGRKSLLRRVKEESKT